MPTDQLTFANADDVIALGQQQRQSFHQQQSFMVAQRRGLAVVKHLIKRRRLDLNTQHLSQSANQGPASGFYTDHLHGVAEQQPLGRDGGDLVHQTMFPGEEALQTSAEGAAGRHAGFVELIQLPDHCSRELA